MQTTTRMPAARRSSPILLALAAAFTVALSGAPAFADDPWPDIKRDVFNNRDIIEEDGTITLEAPYRAEDAAVVPLTMRIPASAGDVKTLTLVIEKNPAPVAATFHFGDAAGKGDRMLSTRVRIDMYSNVRAVIETADGKLHMTTKYVKASGGCSAPADKDTDEALANLGKMQIRTFDKPGDRTPATREAQVMVRHPNFTGMQMDQVTRDYTPARFVRGAAGEARRRPHLPHGRRHLHFGEPQLPLHVCAGEGQYARGHGQGHRRRRVHGNLDRQGVLSQGQSVLSRRQSVLREAQAAMEDSKKGTTSVVPFLLCLAEAPLA